MVYINYLHHLLQSLQYEVLPIFSLCYHPNKKFVLRQVVYICRNYELFYFFAPIFLSGGELKVRTSTVSKLQYRGIQLNLSEKNGICEIPWKYELFVRHTHIYYIMGSVP